MLFLKKDPHLFIENTLSEPKQLYLNKPRAVIKSRPSTRAIAKARNLRARSMLESHE